jgi:hypothetical protein
MKFLSFSQVFLSLSLILGCLFSDILAELTVHDDHNSPLQVGSNGTTSNTVFGTQFVISPLGLPTTTGVSDYSSIEIFITSATRAAINGTIIYGNTTTTFANPTGDPTVPLMGNNLFPSTNGTSPLGIYINTSIPATVQFVVTTATQANGNHINSINGTNTINATNTTGSGIIWLTGGTLVYPNASPSNTSIKYIITTINTPDAAFSVVAAQNNTQVSITFPGQNTTTQNLSLGQVIYYQGSNLNGTIIEANDSTHCSVPISVFEGRTCAGITNEDCSYLLEAVPPSNTYGRTFIYVSPSFFPNSDTTNTSTLLIFTAHKNGTSVTINNSTRHNLPNVGQTLIFTTTNSTAVIEATHSIDVQAITTQSTKGSGASQTQISLVPVSHSFNFARFQAFGEIYPLVIIANQHDVNITGNNLMFNGVPITGSLFQPIPKSSFSAVFLSSFPGVNQISANFSFTGYLSSGSLDLTNYGSPINRLMICPFSGS